MKVLAYISDNTDYMVNTENFKGIDHVFYCFATLKDTDGNLNFPITNIENLKEIKAINPDMTMSISVGGWSAGNFSEMAEDEAKRKHFINQLIEFVIEYDMDGIDMDWEYPGSGSGGISYHFNDKYNYSKLSDEMREALDELEKANGRKYVMSLAIGSFIGSLNSFEVDNLNKNYDYLNIMNYDFIGMDRITCHHSNLHPSKYTPHKNSIVDYMNYFKENGLDTNKIVLGMPFYGRGADKVEERGNGLGNRIYGEIPKFYDFDDIEKYIEKNPSALKVDESCGCSYYYDGDLFITFDSPEAVAEKMQYARDKNYAGVMFWEYATDKTGKLIRQILENK